MIDNMYITLKKIEGDVSLTSKVYETTAILDFDENGELVGVELVDVPDPREGSVE